MLVPSAVYRSYGDSRILDENLEMMERWLGFVERECRRVRKEIDALSPALRRWNDCLFTKGFHFGDRFIPSFVRRGEHPFAASAARRDFVGSCFHAIEECYLTSEGRVAGDLQGLYVVVLRAGVGDSEAPKCLVLRLTELIEQNGDRLDTGFVSTPLVLNVLVDHGYRELAYRVLIQTEGPAWLSMVERGDTTIWEHWEAIGADASVMPSSLDHYAIGSAGDFIYRHIGGIRATAPGYTGIRFAPDLVCGLQSADCSIETAPGRASCSWQRSVDDGCTIVVDVPHGCEATLAIGGIEIPLHPGTSEHRVPTLLNDQLHKLKERDNAS